MNDNLIDLETESIQVGQIKIADEVIAIIASLAATEVNGIYGMAGNITGEIVERLGKKNLSKGVKVELGDNDVSIALFLVIRLGYKIPEIAEQVQQKVKYALETMTGLSVIEVNVHIMGVHVEKQSQKEADSNHVTDK